MNKKILLPACFFALILLALNFTLVFAHETVNIGDYQIEIGWLTEPPISGQINGIIVNVSQGEEEPVGNVSNLIVKVSYGGQSKTLTLQPLGEDTSGQFVAPILPSIPGQYTIKLGGKIGDTDVSAEVEPEEVQTPDAIQFPFVEVTSQSAGFSLTGWLSWLGVVLGIAGISLGSAALRKNR